jgi:hypothetical protein
MVLPQQRGPQIRLDPRQGSDHQIVVCESDGICFEQNNFKFNGEHYLQLAGSTMSSCMSSNYADIYMAYFEDLFIYTHRIQPLSLIFG